MKCKLRRRSFVRVLLPQQTKVIDRKFAGTSVHIINNATMVREELQYGSTSPFDPSY